MEITSTGSGGELDIKRLYLPFEIKTECPKCKTETVRDLEQEYLSYPSIGKPEDVHFYCDECDHEWGEKIILEISIKKA